ncbi:MAG: hypothetical protein GC178_15225 [Flavobacteriales bacterium]|nr:hypothetical protein [Flavobacteriales bacterium]
MRAAAIIFLQLLLVRTAVVAIPVHESDSTRYTGFVVALAWPKAWAKEAGDGYDHLMRGLGFNDGGFYRVGHAALILVNAADSSCHYFDFGRYHTPVGFGRVRDAETDHELTIATKAVFDGKHLTNLDAILCEVQYNGSTHASGPMYASYVRIDYEKAFDSAKALQEKGAIPYGPFEKGGLNCSRFVRQIILAGEPNWAHALRLEVVPMITPTTLYPVSALYHWTKVPGCLDKEAEERKERLSALPDSLFKSVIPEPDRPLHIPIEAQWLAGESSGSWFHLQKQENGFLLVRYAQNGQQECMLEMQQTDGMPWDGSPSFVIAYPSHCAEVNLTIDGEKVRLRSLSPQQK